MAVPALLLCALAAGDIFLTTRRCWFAAEAFTAHKTVMRWAFWGSAVALLIGALSKRARRLALEHLERTGRLDPGRQAVSLGVAYLGIFSLLSFMKYCQYRGCNLTQDTAAMANIVYNFLHHRTLECSVFGVASYLHVHFMPALVLWSPLLLLRDSVLPLFVPQTVLLASVPIAAYLLAWRRSGSSLAGWVALWLVFTSPFFFELASADLYFAIAFPAFCLWGLCFAEAGRWKAAAVCGLLLACTIEQSCVLFFGLGLYLIFKSGARPWRKRWVGAGVCAGALLLWYLEMRLIRSSPEGRTFNSWYWGNYFGSLAPSPEALLKKAATQPAAFIRQVFWPPLKLASFWKLLLSTGGLCLLAPAELVSWAVTFLPHLVSNPDCYYHDLRLQYSAYVTGPLWWAMASGAAWLFHRLAPVRLHAVLLAVALGFGACNLTRLPPTFMPSWPAALQLEAPALADQIPPGASVWSYEFTAPLLACRDFLKIFPYDVGDRYFSSRSFVPDYILLGKYMNSVHMDPRSRDRFFTFLAREGYVKVDESSLLVLLKHPRAPLAPPGVRPPAVELPEPGPGAEAFGKSIVTISDPAAEIRRLVPDAEQGDLGAQHLLAVVYGGSLGGPRDMVNAAKWFRKSAEQGDARDEYNLGICLAVGNGTRRDEVEAKMWLKRAAAHGFAEAGPTLTLLEQALVKTPRASR